MLSQSKKIDAPARLEQPELLDLGHGSQADVAQNLAEMWRTNRYLGGVQAITRHLYPRLLALHKPATVLDLGTGSADLPLALVKWSQQHNIKLQVCGIDWAARNLAVAHEHIQNAPGIQLIQADASNLPFRAQQADYVISSLFLHHFTPPQAVQLLRAAFDTASHGLIMSDAVRGWLPLVFWKLGEPIFARNYLTRHDGALSIRRAYTPAELLELAHNAGLPNPKVTTHWLWRMTLVADR
jgi:2-polyprenyl-3-methyl-5-hydroxy-6-metoxy-1,4-benzoquinol methylase